jgi:hypothetical protein
MAIVAMRRDTRLTLSAAGSSTSQLLSTVTGLVMMLGTWEHCVMKERLSVELRRFDSSWRSRQ